MRTALAIVLGLAAFIRLSGAAGAQNTTLTGIAAILPVVETLSEDAEYCGLNAPTISRSVEQTIGESRLRIRDVGLYLYINVLSAYTGTVDYCISSINVELVAPQSVRLDATHRRVLANITLWEIGGVFGSARDHHFTQVLGMIQRYTRDFVAAWARSQGGPAER